MTVVVTMVWSLHTIYKLIVCLFLTKQHVRNQQKHSHFFMSTYMCGIGVNVMMSRLDMLDRLGLIDWRWKRVLYLMLGGEGGRAVPGVDLEQGQGVGDHIHAHREGGEGEDGHLEGW